MSSHPQMKDNRDICCYFITKHSWKGKYKRIFSVGTKGITTYNPSSLEVTNQWPYKEIVKIEPNVKAPANNEFLVTMRKGPKKTDTMRFSTDHRASILTEALRFQDEFSAPLSQCMRFGAFKHHWSESRVRVVLEVSPSALHQINPANNKRLCSYDYKDMEGLATVSDIPGGLCIVHGGFSRLHLFAVEQRDELVRCVSETAGAYVGLAIKQRRDPITQDEFQENRMGKYSTDIALTSYAEFTVHKVGVRHADPVRRILGLTESCLVERDPATYHLVTCKPLCDIFTIVRSSENPQELSVEHVKGGVRTYRSTERDALIASLLDGVRASGNRDVCVRMSPTDRGMRLGPFTVPVDEEVESQHLKLLQTQGGSFSIAVRRFNSNVSYSGLLHAVTAEGLFAENKEKLITGALLALIEKSGDQTVVSNVDLEMQFHALRRLVASKAGYAAFLKIPSMKEKMGMKVITALKRKDDGVTHAAVDMINTLLVPMHDDYDLRQEQNNKGAILHSKGFLESLLDMFTEHIVHGSGALVISAMLDFLTFSLCAPYSETTDSAHFDVLLEMVADRGRAIFKLFQHPSMAIVKGAGLVMKAIIEEGEAEVAARMQALSLAEGALPTHLLNAMFTQSSDSRALTIQQLSRHLVGLWVSGHPTAMALLKRIMPTGLLAYLDSVEEVPEKDMDRMHVRDNLKLAQDQLSKTSKRNPHLRVIEKQIEGLLLHWRQRVGVKGRKKQQKEEKPIVLRKRRQRIKSEANWALFYYHFVRDHAKPNLIWNYKTREELKEALENEIRAFHVDRELTSMQTISWNHQEFYINYNCLAEEIKIGDYYLRLLLEEEDSESTEETSAIKKSYEFFNDLYHRFLLTPKVAMKCMCLHAMTIVYGRCSDEIGAFNDTKYIVGMLERSTDKLERDRLVLFINKLILNKRNVRSVMDAGGIKILVDLLTLAHLHTSRATVPLQSNVIEASPDMKRDSEKEWYYGNKVRERLGPFSYDEMKELYEEGTVHAKSRCWAQGMEGWKPLHQVAQLKWGLLATSQPLMNESDLATLVLNMLIRICDYFPSRDADDAVIRPLPRAKRVLSDATCLPHIVQLLMTFDPVLVEKVATLLMSIMKDNPAMSRVYLSGVFFFIMMYTGSNVLPIARLLKYTHLQQAFRSEEVKASDLVKRSILGNLLPEAMVCYLENYEPEQFASIFLGEFDSPEAIWNAEMRRLMIEKIASHLADFSPRLMCNTRALYQYVPIPSISFPQLENELFCNIYYLRHLCDQEKFPDWPIKDPVVFLKDVLMAWKAEVEKKPPSMSIDEAYETLGLTAGTGGHNESKVRKAYFKLAQKYHPDKNPDGRDMFEKVNKAYEFLGTKSKRVEGPDPHNIVLVLRAQSILFKRYREELNPYKYSGYPMLIHTVEMETADDALFSKSPSMLAESAELAYHTINCSPLNAEELRRERGIDVLQEAFSRCVSVINASSKPTDMAAQVCVFVTKCYAVASQFQACREKIQELPIVAKELSRVLYYKNLPGLNTVVADCVRDFSVDFCLQTAMFQAGVLWHLLSFLFNYDFTLEEGGVESSADSNQQQVSNDLAKKSLLACAALCGCERDGVAYPDNPAVRASLNALLSPYLVRKLRGEDPSEVLKLLNSNTENPYLMWDNATRVELNEYLGDQQQKVVKTGEGDADFGASFTYSIYTKELIVGEIFVRIYNEQSTFPLENPKGFTLDLLEYLGSKAQYLHSLVSLQQSDKTGQQDLMANIQMALQALHNVIKNNAGVELQCVGYFRLLFSLLGVVGCENVQRCALEVLGVVTTSQECVADIAASEVLSHLLTLVPTLTRSQPLIIDILYALISNTKIVKEALLKGALMYFLDLFCSSSNPTVREKSAELFAKMMADKLVGPRVRIVLSRFLPVIFTDAMRDSPESSVHMFEAAHENPELIWNDEARESVCETVKNHREAFHAEQLKNPTAKWNLPEDFAVVYEGAAGELVVGGVFLRLFNSNPGWILRKPKEFLTELLEKWAGLTSAQDANGEHLEMVTEAIVCLFQAQPAQLDNVPQLGYTPRVLNAMGARNSAYPKHALQIVHQLAKNELCIRSLANLETIRPVKKAMERRPDCISLAAEALHTMYSYCGGGPGAVTSAADNLVGQALSADLVPYLLSLLSGGTLAAATASSGGNAAQNPAAVKAQIVKALKAMQKSEEHGPDVSLILDESDVWKDYKEQRHDLFITGSAAAGYLTGGAPNVAGYLTSGRTTANAMSDKPPPMADHHDDGD